MERQYTFEAGGQEEEESKTNVPAKQVTYTDDEDEEEKTVRKKPKQKKKEEEEEDEDDDDEEQSTVRKKPKKKKEEVPEPPSGFTLTASGAAKKDNQKKNLDVDLLYEKRILTHEVKESFKDMDQGRLVSLATKNQVVHLVQQATQIDFSKDESIIDYISKKGHNYNEAYSLNFLAKGGESYVLTADLKQPQEIVVKTVLPENASQKTMTSIISESHLIKLLENKEYVVDIFEEIIEFQKDQNSIMNYLVVVEQARNDLKHVVSVWLDRKKSYESLEFYSPDKLFYFFFRTCQAIEYLHSQDIYYGDMKEANILVFRDYSIKLGDFGISVKMDPTVPPNEEAFELKGLTHGYTQPQMEQSMLNDDGSVYSRNQLIKNDYYGLQQTFKLVMEQVENLNKKVYRFDETYLYRFMEDMSQLDPEKFSITNLIQKYLKELEDDRYFFIKAVARLVKHEKFLAIPNFLKLWKHKSLMGTIQKYFNDHEAQEYPFLHPEQKTLIPEDEQYYSVDLQAKKKKIRSKAEVIAELRPYVSKSDNFFWDYSKVLPFLVRYKGPLEPTFYNSFYHDLFADFFVLVEGDDDSDDENQNKVKKETPLINFVHYTKDQWYSLVTKYRAFEFDSLNGMTMLNFLLFWGGISDGQNIQLLKAFDLTEEPFFELIRNKPREKKYFIRFLLDKMEYNVKMGLPVNFQIYDRATFALHHGMVRILDQQRDIQKYDLEGQAQNFRCLYDDPMPDDIYFAVHMNLGNKLYADQFERIYQEDKKQIFEMYLKRQKVIQGCFGMLGDQIASHSHSIFKFLKENYANKTDEDSKNLYKYGVIQLKKACNYSTKDLRQIYILDLLEEFHSSGQKEQFEATLIKKQLSKLNMNYRRKEINPYQIKHKFLFLKTLESYKILNSFLYELLHFHYISKKPLEQQEQNRYIKEFVSNYAIFSKIQQSYPKMLEIIVDYFGIDPEYKYAKIHTFYNDFIKSQVISVANSHISSNQLSGDLSFDLEGIGKVQCYVEGGQIYGEFKIEFIETSMLRVIYENGNLSGPTVYKLSDGTIIEEYFTNGMKDGEFKLKSYQESLEGEFADNKLKYIQNPDLKDMYYGGERFYTRHGAGVYFTKQKGTGMDDYGMHKASVIPGPVKMGMWHFNTLKFGQEIEYDKDLVYRLNKQLDVVDGIYSGVAIEYLSGRKKKKRVRLYIKGKLVGREFYFLEDQNLYKEKEMEVDQKIAYITKYYDSGEVKQKYKKVRGFKDGKYQEFYKKGSLKNETEFDDGREDGLSIEYYPNGKMFSKCIFKSRHIEGAVHYYNEDGSEKSQFKKENNSSKRFGEKTILGETGQVSKVKKFNEEKGKKCMQIFYNIDGGQQIVKDFVSRKMQFFDRSGQLFGEFDGQSGTNVTEFYSTGEIKQAKVKTDTKHIYRYFKNGQIQYDCYEDEDEDVTIEIYYDAEGKLLSKNLDGNGVIYHFYDNGQVKEKFETKYQKDGKYELFYENGNKKAEGTYVKDQLDGVTTYYCIDQPFKYEIEYKSDKFASYTSFQGENKVGSQVELDGTKNGIFFQFYENGKLQFFEEYKDNVLVGKRNHFYYDGNLVREANYSQGEIMGEEKWYFPNGTLLKTSIYKDGLLDGPTTFFDKDGKVDCKMLFSQNKLTAFEVTNPIFKNLEGC